MSACTECEKGVAVDSPGWLCICLREQGQRGGYNYFVCDAASPPRAPSGKKGGKYNHVILERGHSRSQPSSETRPAHPPPLPAWRTRLQFTSASHPSARGSTTNAASSAARSGVLFAAMPPSATALTSTMPPPASSPKKKKKTKKKKAAASPSPKVQTGAMDSPKPDAEAEEEVLFAWRKE